MMELPLFRYRIDPFAFVIALVLAPLIPAVALFWMLFIPVFAVGFGGIPYLLFGTPAFLYALSVGWRDPPRIGLIAFLANAFFCAFLWIAAEPAVFFLAFGSVFAFIWGVLFAILYWMFERPRFQQPIERILPC